MTAAALYQSWTACARSLRLWVLELVAWMATVTQWRDMRLLARADLRHLRSEIRWLIVTRLAVAIRQGLIAPKQRRNRNGARHEDRFLSRRRFMRFALRRVRLRTLDQCRNVLDRLECVALRCARDLDGGVAVRALHWRMEPRAHATSVCGAVDAQDTS